MAGLTRSQIDRLGERLRKGSPSPSDIRLLDDYRRSFGDAFQHVIRIIGEQHLSPTGRSAKSTISIIDKLRRESIRLSQMQDIAGCRIVVSDILEQERVVDSLTRIFEKTTIIDRRAMPSHGYRAVHMIVEMHGKPIEIQVRSRLQHLWAELSEKASDVIDPAIKYGGGPERWRIVLADTSEMIRLYEDLERTPEHQVYDMAELYRDIVQDCNDIVASLDALKRRKQ